MNKTEITVQDCIDMYEKKGKAVILKDGEVKGFIEEN